MMNRVSQNTDAMKAVKARGVVPQAGGSRAFEARRMAVNFAKLQSCCGGRTTESFPDEPRTQ
jgi:hypothetical protein